MNQQQMQGIARYTTLFAPVIFFFGGIFIVILLNKFIGKGMKPSDTKPETKQNHVERNHR